ncbi:serine protease [Mesorhizobium sp. M0136]|uniref:trypsin-like serine peptidase n=1 Tax=Mesorhizobium sp. M0136 TaxID=2956890 RepID=UPI0033378A6F
MSDIAERVGIVSISLVLAMTAKAGNSDEATSTVCSTRESTSEFGRWVNPDVILNVDNKSYTISPAEYDLVDIGSWRLQLSDNTNSSVNWLVTVRDRQGRPLSIIRRTDQASTAKSIFTERLISSELEVDVDGLEKGDGEIKVTGATAYPGEGGDVRLFSVQGATPNWGSPYPSGGAEVFRLADSVGMLLTGATDPQTLSQKSWSCSGVLIGESLFLTNWHCGGERWLKHELYWNDEVRGNCLMDFRWDEGTARSQFSCGEIAAQSEKLDYALLELGPLAGGPSLSSLPAAVPIDMSGVPDQIFILHHARSKPKLLSKNCHATSEDNNPDLFLHDCDTDPGASGGPVFDSNTKRLVGIHHAGFVRDENCQVVKAFNEGVRISPIISDACTNKKNEGLQKLCRELKQ